MNRFGILHTDAINKKREKSSKKKPVFYALDREKIKERERKINETIKKNEELFAIIDKKYEHKEKPTPIFNKSIYDEMKKSPQLKTLLKTHSYLQIKRNPEIFQKIDDIFRQTIEMDKKYSLVRKVLMNK